MDSSVLQLQAMAGNRATSELLGRHDPGGRVAQRESLILGLPPPEPAAGPMPSSSPLSAEARTELVRITGARIRDSVGAFGYACVTEKAAIKAEIADKTEMIALLLEIGFAFAPVVGKALSKNLARLTEVKGVTAEFAQAAREAVKEELHKATVESVFKVGMAVVKKETPEVYGQSAAENFVDTLFDQARVAGDRMDQHLPGRTDHELASLFAYFDPETLASGYYVRQIKDLVEGFQAVTESKMYPNRAMYVQVRRWRPAEPTKPFSIRKLALFPGTMSGPGGGLFLRWMPARLTDMAMQRTEKFYGAVETVDESDVWFGTSKAEKEYEEGVAESERSV